MLLALALLPLARPVPAADPLDGVASSANARVVKLFGAGGFRGVTGYGSGVLVGPNGLVLTVASPLLETNELVVHLSDGRRLKAQVAAREPALDLALVKIVPPAGSGGDLGLPYFDLELESKRPPARPGDWVLALANPFEIAVRDEPASVQHGVVAARSKLAGRRGIFEFPYTGEVYVLDAITNNPGAAGGALVDRSGHLLGLLGREIKNTATETWLNYAVPLDAKIVRQSGGKETSLSLMDFVRLASAGRYKPSEACEAAATTPGYHGLTLVPNVLPRTPPYVEEVAPGSPAERAGLKPNDLVSFADGEPVPSVKALLDLLARKRPGAAVVLEVRRGQVLVRAELTLGAAPGAPSPPPNAAPPMGGFGKPGGRQ